jgi:predicted metal-dependent hydrolase
MPEIRVARYMADRLSDHAADIEQAINSLRSDGWYVSAQQLQNAVQILQDVERRLRNDGDLNG